MHYKITFSNKNKMFHRTRLFFRFHVYHIMLFIEYSIILYVIDTLYTCTYYIGTMYIHIYNVQQLTLT